MCVAIPAATVNLARVATDADVYNGGRKGQGNSKHLGSGMEAFCWVPAGWNDTIQKMLRWRKNFLAPAL